MTRWDSDPVNNDLANHQVLDLPSGFVSENEVYATIAAIEL
jgi:hypothetical protein